MTDQHDNPYASPRDPTDATVAEWGPSLPREYRCNKLVRWVAGGIAIFGGALVLYMDGSFAWTKYRYGLRFTPSDLTIGAVYGVIHLELLWAWWVFHRMAGVSVVLHDGELVYRHRGGEKRVPLDQISALEPGRPRRGALRLRVAGEAVNLPLHLQRVSELLGSLQGALDARGLSQTYDRDWLFGLFRAASYGDQSWQRFEPNVWTFLLLTALSGASGGLLAYARDSGTIAAIIWVFVPMLGPIVVCAVAEQILFTRFKRNANKNTFTCPPLDPAWVRSVYRIALGFGVVVYAAAASVAYFI